MIGGITPTALRQASTVTPRKLAEAESTHYMAFERVAVVAKDFRANGWPGKRPPPSGHLGAGLHPPSWYGSRTRDVQIIGLVLYL